MIVNFSFRNYRSFGEAQQFSMERPRRSWDGSWQRPGVSAVAACYGPNGSGKSNLLGAMGCLSKLVRQSHRSGDEESPLDVEPFLLDGDLSARATEFLVEFYAGDGLRYVYSLGATASEVTYEELTVYRTSQPSRLFSRTTEEGGGQRISFGASLRGPKRQLWAITRRNSLVLSAAGAIGMEALAPAYAELSRGIGYYDSSAYSVELRNIKALYLSGSRLLEDLGRLVDYADLGVRGIDVRRVGPGGDGAAPSPGEWDRNTDIFFLHRGRDGDSWFPSALESDGTLAAVAFLSLALRALGEGSTILVDEMERSLHPALVREFVGLFADPATNPRQAQLIFSTHDTSLINLPGGADGVLRRDQVWLCEKDGSGMSRLVPVSDYSPRREENLGRNYLNGVYGALPSPSLHERVAQLLLEEGESRE